MKIVIPSACIAALLGVPLLLLILGVGLEVTAASQLPSLYARSVQGSAETVLDIASSNRLEMAVLYPGGVLAVESTPRGGERRRAAPGRPSRVELGDYDQAVLADALRARDVVVLNRNEVPGRARFEPAAVVQWMMWMIRRGWVATMFQVAVVIAVSWRTGKRAPVERRGAVAALPAPVAP